MVTEWERPLPDLVASTRQAYAAVDPSYLRDRHVAWDALDACALGNRQTWMAQLTENRRGNPTEFSHFLQMDQ